MGRVALESTSSALQAAATPSQLPAHPTKRPGCRMTPGPGRTIAVASAGVSQAQRMHGQRIRRSTGETSRFGSLTDVTGPPGQHRDLARLGACFRSGEGRPSGPTPSRSCPCRRRGRRRCSRRHRIYPGGSPGLEAQVRDTRLFARNCSSRGDRSPSRLSTIILFNSREQSERDGALRRRPSGAGSRRGWSTTSEVHARPGLTDRLFRRAATNTLPTARSPSV